MFQFCYEKFILGLLAPYVVYVLHYYEHVLGNRFLKAVLSSPLEGNLEYLLALILKLLDFLSFIFKVETNWIPAKLGQTIMHNSVHWIYDFMFRFKTTFLGLVYVVYGFEEKLLDLELSFCRKKNCLCTLHVQFPTTYCRQCEVAVEETWLDPQL